MAHLAQVQKLTDRGKHRIALICDCDAIKAELKTVLGSKEYTVDCYSPDSYSSAFSSEDASLVVLDAGYNIKKGLTLLREFKAKKPGCPVIFLTDDSSEDDVVAAFRLGARDFFRKPLNVFLFRETVHGLIKIKKTSHERRLSLNHRQCEFSEVEGKARTDMPESILKALVFMNNHLAEPLSLATLAGQAGMSRHHFCRVFKKHTGETPMQSLVHMRIERAKSLLRSGHFTISMVAIEAGFSDISAFVRHFKRETGITATDFRNTVRAKN